MEPYDVVVIGGGVSGAATLYILSKFTNIKKIALVEKYSKLATVNSSKDNNAQTLHIGDIETNYTLEKARKVKTASSLVACYVENHKNEKIHSITHKMVLGVGKKQGDALRKRYKEFKKLFPDLRILTRKEIAKYEPLVVKGRPKDVDITALFSKQGHIVDYAKLARSMVKHSQQKNKTIDIILKEKVRKIEKKELYEIKTNKRTLHTKSVVVAAGSHSLGFAHELGYGKEWILLPVAGTFFYSKKKVNGKVYRLQIGGIPFSAVHADPDVHNYNETRYGPRAKVLPMLERYNYASVFEFLKLFKVQFGSIKAAFSVLFEPEYFKYMMKQVLYDIPFIGKRIFMKELRDIIPTLKIHEVKTDKHIGGIRPQMLDVKKEKLVMGEAKLVGKNILFDITPSPGASTCLKNGLDNAKNVIKFLGSKYKIDEKKFISEFKCYPDFKIDFE